MLILRQRLFEEGYLIGKMLSRILLKIVTESSLPRSRSGQSYAMLPVPTNGERCVTTARAAAKETRLHPVSSPIVSIPRGLAEQPYAKNLDATNYEVTKAYAKYGKYHVLGN